MKRIAIWIAATVTVVVLLFGYHTSTNKTAAIGAATAPTTGQQPPIGNKPSAGTAPPEQSTGSGISRSSKSPGSAAKRTGIGDIAQTERGPVQVEVVVKKKKVTDVKILQVPSEDPMDVRINQFAVPILIRETLSAQSSKIDMVSGATVTSDGYVQSLQSALDRAGL